MPLQYPQINGVRYDFSSVDIKAPDVSGAVPVVGFKSLNYKHSLKPGKLKGNKAQPYGRTRGTYEASGDAEVYKSEWDAFTTLLGPGYMERSFQLVASHSEPSLGPDLLIVDQLIGVRITDEEDSKSEGEEPLIVKVTFDIMMLKPNGKSPINPLKALL